MSSIRRHIPLPFQGNKTNRIDSFIEHINSLPNNLTFIDLFGGSCYLSYVIHKLKPNAKIICNDFDDYRERLKNVNITNELLSAIKLINPEKEQGSKYNPKEREQIKQLLLEYGREHWLDIITLSNALCFSSMRATNIDQLLSRFYYNRIPQKPYNVDWYLKDLEGIEFVQKDWKKLYEEYKDKENICFIADPPYFNTDQGSYQNKWTFSESLKTLNILTQEHFVYYSSNKSLILPLLEYLNNNLLDNKINYTCITIPRSQLNNRSKAWTDIMLIK